MSQELFDETSGNGSGNTAPIEADTRPTRTRRRNGQGTTGATEETPLTAESSPEPGGSAPLMAAPTSPLNYLAPPLPERITEARSGLSAPNMFAGEGLTFPRFFTKTGEDVYDTVEWDHRTAAITGERGEVVFEQKECEIPKQWSMLATNVVVSKYFRGKIGTPQRETSVKQLISRVADTILKWGKQGNYFASDSDAETFHDELKYLLLHQYMAFNSPVWFNLGVPGERPQASACQPYDALVSTPQGLIPIGKLVEENAVGTVVFDVNGTTRILATKANGRKNVLRLHTKAGYTLDVTADHLVWQVRRRATPAVSGQFVEAGQLQAGDQLLWVRTPLSGKAEEGSRDEDEAILAGWLQSDGFVGQYVEGTNRSLTIEAMVVNAEEETWVRTALQNVFPEVHSHTRPVVTRDEALNCQRIRLSGDVLRPFVEKWNLLARGTAMQIPLPLFHASYAVVIAYLRSLFQAEGYVNLRDNAAVGLDMISEDMVRGVQKLLLRFGIYSRVRYKADSRANRKGCWSLKIATLGDRKRFAQQIGFIGVEKQAKLFATLELKGLEENRLKTVEIERIEDLGEKEVYDIQTESGEYLSGNLRVHNCFINSVEDTMESILTLAKTEGMLFKWGSGTGTNLSVLRSSRESLKGGGTASGPVSFMRGFDAFAGAIKSGGKTRRAAKMVILNADHPDIVEFIECKADAEKKAHALIEAGYSGAFNVPNGAYDSVFFQNANHSVRATDDFMRSVELDRDWSTVEVVSGKVDQTFRARDLMRKISEAAWVCGDPGMQFDTTANRWHTCPNTGRINASNPCSEFFFLDDTACNLASLNLMRFRTPSRELDLEAFRHAVRVTVTAMEILVSNAAYPTDKITINSYDYRPLGLGYANLGALLMARGVPYDSDEGRAYAAVLTAILSGEGYSQSARIAERVGPFAGFERNRQPMLRVMQMHRDHVEAIPQEHVPGDLVEAARHTWDRAIELGQKSGYRNSQISVLAPTGCLVGGSLVLTDRGLMRLNRLGDVNGAQWQDVHFRVLTDDGAKTATQFYINGVEATRRITTDAGYTIQGTLKHRIKVVETTTGQMVWKRFADIAPGDVVALSMGQLLGEPHTITLPPLGEEYWTGDYTTKVPRTMTPELAELIGYFMGDGSLHSKGPRFCVANTDPDVAERVKQLLKDLFDLNARITEQNGYCEVAAHSVPLTLWWEACGFVKHRPAHDVAANAEHRGKGYIPHIPDAILATNNPLVYGAFLRGLYEADGTVTEGVPTWTTVQASFVEEVKTLLLALGIPTGSRTGMTGWGKSTSYILRLRNSSYAARFMEKVGFIGERKRSQVCLKTGEQTARYDYVYIGQDVIQSLVTKDHPLFNAISLAQKRHNGAITRRAAEALYAETQDARLGHALSFFYDEIVTNEDGGEQPTYDLSVPENVTYIAQGFISHNTIGFLMDCDTTGVEPDIALVKYKSLVGGGFFKIVNQTVPEALERLGYSTTERKAILEHIELQDTVEGAPYLLEEHLPVFDCAFRPKNGQRSIHYMGHIKMMAAVQPFISGAISKTCNLPGNATPDDIAEAYMQAWKLGVKALAIYRDGSKKTQPLSTGKTDEKKEAEYKPMRRKLPDERQSLTHKFSVGGHEGYLTVGLYPDGTPGEIFITMSKEGSVVSGLMDSFATSISLALQYGVPLRTLVEKFMHTRFEPAGFTNNPDIPMAKSIMDYLFRYIALKFLDRDERAHVGLIADQQDGYDNGGFDDEPLPQKPKAETAKRETAIPETKKAAKPPTSSDGAEGINLRRPSSDAAKPGQAGPVGASGGGVTRTQAAERQVFVTQADAPPCPDCGTITTRNGACYRCANCGTSIGCS